MAWVFQPVVNVCIEILLLILFGFLVAWGKVLKSDTFLPQVNLFVLRVSIPVFTIYQLGIRLDLTDQEAWRTLAAYVLWVSIIQVLIIAYIWTFGKKYWAEAGLQNLLLTANNTIMIGLPIMEATWGKAGRFIALLTAVIIFIQILPFSISTFENENWKAKRKAARVVQPPQPPPPDLPLDPSTAATVNVLTEEPPGSSEECEGQKERGEGARVECEGQREGDGGTNQTEVQKQGEEGVRTEGGGGASDARCEKLQPETGLGKQDALWHNEWEQQAQHKGGEDRVPGSHGGGMQTPSSGAGVCGRSGGKRGNPLHVTVVASEDVTVAECRDHHHHHHQQQQQQQQQQGVQVCTRCGRSSLAILPSSSSSSDSHHPRLLTPSSPFTPHHLQQQQQQQQQQPCRRSHSNADIHSPCLFSHTLPTIPQRVQQQQQQQQPWRRCQSSADIQLSLCSGQHQYDCTILSGSHAAETAAARENKGVRSCQTAVPDAAVPGTTVPDAAERSATGLRQTRHAGIDEQGRPAVGAPVAPFSTRVRSASSPHPPDLCSISMPAAASVPSAGDEAYTCHGAGLHGDGLQGGHMMCPHCGAVWCRAGQLGRSSQAVSEKIEGRQAEGGEREGYLDPGMRGYTITCSGSSSSCAGSGSSNGSQCCSKQNHQQQQQHQHQHQHQQQHQPGLPPVGSDEVSQQKGWASKHRLGSSFKRLGSRITASTAIWDGARGRGRGLPGLLAIIDNPLFSGSHSPHHQSQPHQQSKRHQRGKEHFQERWRASKQHLRGVQQHISARMETMPEGVRLAFVILKNPMLWSIFIALVVSCSGLRQFLDPDSPQFRLEVGWITELFRLIAGTTVPLSLFNNGVWLYGKQFWKGNIRKFLVVMFIKIVCLPFLQLGCTKAVGLSTPAGMSLIILSICPVATMSFVVSSQYNHGADIVTMVTVAGTMLLVPLVLAALNLPKEWGFYDYDVSQMPLD